MSSWNKKPPSRPGTYCFCLTDKANAKYDGRRNQAFLVNVVLVDNCLRVVSGGKQFTFDEYAELCGKGVWLYKISSF